MTGIVILNVVLIAVAVAGIVGLLAWGIVSSMDRASIEQMRSRRSSRLLSLSELRSDAVERGFTTFVPLRHVNGAAQVDDRR
jgi:hypothetical protein